MNRISVQYKPKYYPNQHDSCAFGMEMGGRSFSSQSYRYGFNGKENDGETGTQDYGFRIYNPAIGKFLSVDPLTAKYPYLTPYQFASNTPISCVDLDGAESMLVTITPSQTDPKLTKVTVTKILAKVEQQNLTVTYRYLDAQGNVMKTEELKTFKQGSVEETKMNQTNAKGQKTIDRLAAGTFTKTFTPNTLQDPEAVAPPVVDKDGTPHIGWTVATHSFQYDLDIKFKDDKSGINANDLAPGTSANTLSEIEQAKNTLGGPVQFTNTLGKLSTLSLSQRSIVVTGETDGKSSNYNNGCGNPCLAEDRATSLQSSLQSGSNGLPNTMSTQTVNHTGGDNQQERKSSILMP